MKLREFINTLEAGIQSGEYSEDMLVYSRDMDGDWEDINLKYVVKEGYSCGTKKDFVLEVDKPVGEYDKKTKILLLSTEDFNNS
jgi:hypothetical protein